MKVKSERYRARDHLRDEIEHLIEGCGSENCFEQQDARIALERIGEEAVDPLIQALLNNVNPTIRWRAAEALGHIGDLRAIEPLIRALKDDDVSVQWRAIEALVDIGEPAVRHLKAAMAHDDDDVQYGAVRAMREINMLREQVKSQALYSKTGENLWKRPT